MVRYRQSLPGNSLLGLLLLASLAAAQDPRDIDLPESNPYTTAADVETGRRYFLGHCAVCHGPEGEGGRGVNLTSGVLRRGNSDRELYMTLRQGIPGSEMPASRLSPPELWRLAAYVRRLGSAGAHEKAGGDAQAGRAIYAGKGGCGVCHVVNGEGSALGPELTQVGLRRSLKFLRDSLVEPSAHVAPANRSATVVLQNGSRVRGIVLNEDEYSIQLRDMRGDLRSFFKAETKEVKAEAASLMPSYKSALTPRELDDLIAYLSSLRGER
jgi:putative heme-binding domain-containing protein